MKSKSPAKTNPDEPTKTGTKPVRQRDATATRADILRVARMHFCRFGYRDAGMRAIAAEVGVNAALVIRYFGSKQALFAEAATGVYSGPILRGGDLATFGLRGAKMIMDLQWPEDQVNPILFYLRSINEPEACEMLRREMDTGFIAPLAEQIGGPNALARAGAILTLLFGTLQMTRVIQSVSLTGEQAESAEQVLAEALQRLVDGEAATGAASSGALARS